MEACAPLGATEAAGAGADVAAPLGFSATPLALAAGAACTLLGLPPLGAPADGAELETADAAPHADSPMDNASQPAMPRLLMVNLLLEVGLILPGTLRAGYSGATLLPMHAEEPLKAWLRSSAPA